ncbi:MAG: YidC/Oxa1 family membrane protein insertase [Clostridia bacterium]|nr:YidC/Oxa1 family membrane protein insertase [Clostridia bacterium]MBN2883643.1 YidC/Oxa1 family membrane protein insertase [Clostridia bacterium]
MTQIIDTLLRALGAGFYFLYNTIGFHNFGLTIIFFTLITKLILFPLTLKSQKSSQEMSALQPEVKRLQEKYKNDKEKQNQEIQALYKENNVSCMGGCLPMLLQFPILIALYSVLRRPLTLVVGKTSEAILNLVNKLPAEMQKVVSLSANTTTFDKINQVNELKLVNLLTNNPGYLDNTITSSDLINLKFLGLNLGEVPTIKPDLLFGEQMWIYLPLLIIPIVGVIMTVISQRLMTPPQPKDDKKKDDKNPMGNMGNMMKYMIPGMTLYFSFILPAGMGFYWINTYIFQIFTQLYINKQKKDKDAEKNGNTSKQEPKKLDGGKK